MGPGRREPPQRQTRRRDQGMGVENTEQYHVEKEALRTALGTGKVAMVQVGGGNARIVGPVPRTCGRIGNEQHPQIDRVRGRRPSHSAAPGAGLAAVAHQPFVDRSPPRTAGRHRTERRQHAATDLPAHERQCRPAERQVPGCVADRTVISTGDQRESSCRIVTHSVDLIDCPLCGGTSRTHAPYCRTRRSEEEGCDFYSAASPVGR